MAAKLLAAARLRPRRRTATAIGLVSGAVRGGVQKRALRQLCRCVRWLAAPMLLLSALTVLAAALCVVWTRDVLRAVDVSAEAVAKRAAESEVSDAAAGMCVST